MTSENPFDLNKYRQEYDELGVEASYHVADALVLPEGSRSRAIAALVAARYIFAIRTAEGVSSKTEGALSDCLKSQPASACRPYQRPHMPCTLTLHSLAKQNFRKSAYFHGLVAIRPA
jgi:hypothetical protein